MDDATLRTSLRSIKICTKCDLDKMEGIKHILMSCHDSKSDIDEMYTEIPDIPDGSGVFFLDTCEHVLPELLGRQYEPIYLNRWSQYGLYRANSSMNSTQG